MRTMRFERRFNRLLDRKSSFLPLKSMCPNLNQWIGSFSFFSNVVFFIVPLTLTDKSRLQSKIVSQRLEQTRIIGLILKSREYIRILDLPHKYVIIFVTVYGEIYGMFVAGETNVISRKEYIDIIFCYNTLNVL